MKKTIRTIKVSIIIGILLFSIFAAFIPSASAGLIGNQVTLVVEPEDPEDLTQLLVEIKQPISIPIKITYIVTGVFSAIAIPIFATKVEIASVSLSVVDPPSYLSASVEPNVVRPKIQVGGSSVTASLKVTFNDYAPAKILEPIKIKMEAQKIDGLLFYIEGKAYTGTISIAPQYAPIVSISPQETFKEVTPGEVVNLKIDLENLGTDKTEFIFRIGDLPEGWVASMPGNKLVDSQLSGGNNKATVTLSVTPPYNFGYHDETQVIKIYGKGQYYVKGIGEVLESEEYEITFQIRNRGFSTPGFEGVFVLLALVGIALIVKKRKKTK